MLLVWLALIGTTRDAAQAAGLPEVLKDQFGRVVRFDGAALPQVSGHNMLINQTADRAVLHWESFDIAAGNSVRFQQPDSTSVALNRVLGQSNARSVIDGQLEANGRVYLINQNGILFGPSSKVNVHSLIASTLDIDDTVYDQVGLVNAVNLEQPAFEGRAGAMGDIECAAGCSIESGKNGRVVLIAPKVTNRGSISSPEGQVVLAGAEDKVYIAAEQEGSEVRGLLVEVSTGGSVHNLGRLVADRGNV
ncbi:MAG: filamentous hemagglutinin N-terminal domain-containing protein, partial [Gammaproteobacteria bacterium]|nr:filamentous hemagglutinin N-terminal domain-containing protein [Gammaproteobacteria bacterium]